MTDDSGTLSIDFIAGFTIFLLAFIWVLSMIPGLLVNLQGYTIDYDAVAYRTGVILVEDPGEPARGIPWEWASYLRKDTDVIRFGLAVSTETPNILSQDKVNRFFDTATFNETDYGDYRKRVIFGDYPYRFNISLNDTERKLVQSVGDTVPAGYGYIRRIVKIKSQSSATIDSTYIASHADYINTYTDTSFIGTNETRHEFAILVNNSGLREQKNPAYEIDPSRNRIMVNITDLKSTMYANRQDCFNISLTNITGKNEKLITIKPFFNDPIIDGVHYHVDNEAMYSTLPFVNDNISLALDPTFVDWPNYPQVYINVTFTLEKNLTACPASNPAFDFSGSQFLNNSFTSPFDYNYDPGNVFQPKLRDAMVEVAIW